MRCASTDSKQGADMAAIGTVQVVVTVRTTAEVKAEALREAADRLEGGLGVEGTPETLWDFRQWLRKQADRLDAGK